MDQLIYYDKDRRRLVDANGDYTSVMAEIAYPQKPNFELHIVDSDNQPVNLSHLVSGRAAIAEDFDDTTDPMSRSTPGMVDMSRAADGIITVSNDADNSPFHEAVNGIRNGEVSVWFEFAGNDVLGTERFYIRFQVKAIMPLDPQGATLPPPAPQSQWADKTWVSANFEKVRTIICEGIELVALGASTLVTIPTGRKFILKQVFILCQEISGSGAQPEFQIRHNPAGGGNNVIYAGTTEHSAVNDISEDRVAYNKAIPAGDSIDINVTSASGHMAHIATIILEGVTIE